MSAASELRALEEQLLQTDFRRDRKAVSGLLADDFREFGSSGRVWNRRELLDLLETEPAFQATVQDFQANELAPGAFLLTYAAVVDRPGSPRTLALRSSIWIERKGRWQIIFHQGTRMPVP